MASRSDLPTRLASGPVLCLDGATGTELEARGVPCELPLWSAHALVEAPGVVEAIHRDYVEAGAEALTANTFRTQARALARGGLTGRDEELTRLAVELARRAADARSWVLGSAPPLEDCYRPELAPDPGVLTPEHAAHARNLARAGVDAVFAETHNTVREAVAALEAAGAAGLPALVSFVCDAHACLLSGESLEEALAAVAPLAPIAVGVNCLPPDHADACLAPLARSGLPFGIAANLGAPGERPGAPREHDCTPEEFATRASAWRNAGAAWIGGCCGTTPAHLRALALQLRV